MNIVILDAHSLNPGDLSWEGIEAMGHVTIYERTGQQDIIPRCKDAEIVLTNKVPFTQETLQALPALRLICVTATGYNIIDCEAARQQGIAVCNIPAYSTDSVAQMVFAHLLTVTNRVEHYTHQVLNEQAWTTSPDFCFWNTPLLELSGKTFGIVGLGQIGMAVARIALAMNMRVIAITSKQQQQLPDGITAVSRDEFFREADIISLHCPLTPTTEGLVCSQTLSLMKPTAIIINTSRGPVVNEQDVAEALKGDRLAAFCTDVLTREPASAHNPLLSAPRVFITPHIAWATLEARTRLMHILEGNIRAYLNGMPTNVVN